MKNKKGISLIVLVITIIVMIILAASVVITLSNTGVINKAGEAVDKTNMQQVQNLASLVWSEEYLDGKRGDTLKEDVLKELEDYNDLYEFDVTNKGIVVTLKGDKGWKQDGSSVTNGKDILYVGDYVDYEAGVEDYEDENGWRVLGAENGELLLVSNKNVIEGIETQITTLAEAQAYYDNFENELAKLCLPFGNGKKAARVRSISGSDLNRITKYDPTTFVGSEFVLAQEGINITDYGAEVAFYWDGTDMPVCKIGDQEYKVDNLGQTKNWTEFVWRDDSTGKWYKSTNNKVAGPIVADSDPTKKAVLHSNTYGKVYMMEFDEGTPEYELFVEIDGENREYLLATTSYGALVTPSNTVMTGYGLHAVFPSSVSIGGAHIMHSGEYGTGISTGVRAVVALEKDTTLAPVTEGYWTITNK